MITLIHLQTPCKNFLSFEDIVYRYQRLRRWLGKERGLVMDLDEPEPAHSGDGTVGIEDNHVHRQYDKDIERSRQQAPRSRVLSFCNFDISSMMPRFRDVMVPSPLPKRKDRGFQSAPRSCPFCKDDTTAGSNTFYCSTCGSRTIRETSWLNPS